MKYLDEYRDEGLARKIVEEIRRIITKPWVLMEVCGGQTHSIVKYGLDRLLPNEIELVHAKAGPIRGVDVGGERVELDPSQGGVGDEGRPRPSRRRRPVYDRQRSRIVIRVADLCVEGDLPKPVF